MYKPCLRVFEVCNEDYSTYMVFDRIINDYSTGIEHACKASAERELQEIIARYENIPSCPDCGKLWEHRGHMDCHSPL